ncbi:hypothetical protein BHE74_00025538 [Ensete ventricosum]|nr:hypothetical protein BHE74_00025538 [Ensete ventricosum]RZS16658.1 hypothetical protein BHM03_00048684 [Ensete ventricosum]
MIEKRRRWAFQQAAQESAPELPPHSGRSVPNNSETVGGMPLSDLRGTSRVEDYKFWWSRPRFQSKRYKGTILSTRWVTSGTPSPVSASTETVASSSKETSL